MTVYLICEITGEKGQPKVRVVASTVVEADGCMSVAGA